jgi:hypothetical protein
VRRSWENTCRIASTSYKVTADRNVAVGVYCDFTAKENRIFNLLAEIVCYNGCDE